MNAKAHRLWQFIFLTMAGGTFALGIWSIIEGRWLLMAFDWVATLFLVVSAFHSYVQSFKVPGRFYILVFKLQGGDYWHPVRKFYTERIEAVSDAFTLTRYTPTVRTRIIPYYF